MRWCPGSHLSGACEEAVWGQTLQEMKKGRGGGAFTLATTLLRALPGKGEARKTPDPEGGHFVFFPFPTCFLVCSLSLRLAETVLLVSALCYLALQLQGQRFLLFNLPPPLPSSGIVDAGPEKHSLWGKKNVFISARGHPRQENRAENVYLQFFDPQFCLEEREAKKGEKGEA